MNRHSPLWKTWAKTVQAKPAALALVDADMGYALSRRELQELAEKFHEENLGGKALGRVVLCCRNSPAWFTAFLAVQRGGGTVIGLDAGTPPEKQEELARSLGAEFLLSEELGEIRLASKKKSKGIVFVKMTSGSTGQPGLIQCKAEHLLADGKAVVKGMGIRPRDRNLALIPLSHSYAIGNVVMPLLLQGTVAVLARAFVPSQIPAWIEKYKVSVLPSVPVVYRLLSRMKTARFESLRLAISAGAALPVETARAFHEHSGLRIHNFYGSSETGGICYDRSGRLALSGKGVGQALPGVKIKIAKSGTITVSGPAVATPWGQFRLADTGAWTGKDTLQLLGRCDVTANIGGKKVSSAEIQKELQKIDGVREAWVGMERQGDRDILIAAVETSLKSRIIEIELSKNLPAWKMPRLLHCAAALPRSTRGKLDTPALRKILLSDLSGPG